jgi:hypothetical protein
MTITQDKLLEQRFKRIIVQARVRVALAVFLNYSLRI